MLLEKVISVGRMRGKSRAAESAKSHLFFFPGDRRDRNGVLFQCL